MDIDRVIAAGRILIGSALLLAPAKAAKEWLGNSAEDPATQAAVRAIGARDVALGLGVFLAIRRGRSPRGWVEAGIVADATDAVATLIAWQHLPARGRAATVAMASGAALTSTLTSIQDRRDR